MYARVIIERVIDLTYIIVLGSLGLVWLERVMDAFPYTAPYSAEISHIILTGLGDFGLGLLEAVPGIVLVVLIFFLSTTLLQAGNSVIDQLARYKIGWLDETSAPTRRIFNIFVWVFALVLAYPHLPGAGSDAFKGISVLSVCLLGRIINCRTSSLWFNCAVYAGLKPDEWVSIGDTEGRSKRSACSPRSWSCEVEKKSACRMKIIKIKSSTIVGPIRQANQHRSDHWLRYAVGKVQKCY